MLYILRVTFVRIQIVLRSLWFKVRRPTGVLVAFGIFFEKEYLAYNVFDCIGTSNENLFTIYQLI